MIKRSNEHVHGRGCMVVITCADRKEHHMAYERMVELVQKTSDQEKENGKQSWEK